MEFDRGDAAFQWWGERFGRVWRVIVQVAKPHRPDPAAYSFHHASACEGCGRPGVQGYCPSCQHRIAAVQAQFWSPDGW